MQRRLGVLVPVFVLTAFLSVASATAQKVERGNLYGAAAETAGEAGELPADLKPGQVAGVVAGFGVGLVRFRKAFEAAVDMLRHDSALVAQGMMSLPDELPPALAGLSSRRGWGPLILNLIVLLAIGGGLAATAAWLTRSRRAERTSCQSQGAGDRLMTWLQLAALAAAPVAALALWSFVAVTTFYFVGGPERNVVAAILSGTVLLAVAGYVAGLLLAPATPSVRCRSLIARRGFATIGF